MTTNSTINSGFVNLSPLGNGLLDALIADSSHVATLIEGTRFMEILKNRFEEPGETVMMPARHLIISVINMFRNFIHGDGPPRSTSELREQILRLMSEIVQDLTQADCVFVRRLHTDGSVELVGDPIWFGGTAIGVPPRIKPLNAGISAKILANPDPRPTVVRDIEGEDASEDLKFAHRSNLNNWPPGSPEHEFVSIIRAEACIPLVVKGRVLGGVVAVRRAPYDAQRAAQLERILSYWREVLAFLYSYALPLVEQERIKASTDGITRFIPLVASSLTDEEFLRKVATLMTCSEGLAWHRAMIFLFRDTYPADAECVVAIGGDGDPTWSQTQASLSAQRLTLRDYLAKTELDEFGVEDPLFRLCQNGSAPLIIPGGEFHRHCGLDALFSASPDSELGFRPGDGVVVLEPRDAWLSQLTTVEPAFRGLALDCQHIVIPIVHQWPYSPLGFVILDNPYPRSVEEPLELTHTRLIVLLFGALFAARGLGVEGWVKHREELRKHEEAAERYLARLELDPTLRDRAEREVRQIARAFSRTG